MEHAYFLPDAKTFGSNRDLKGSGRDAGKQKMPLLVGGEFLLGRVALARKPDRGGNNEVSVWIEHRTADRTPRFTLTLGRNGCVN